MSTTTPTDEQRERAKWDLLLLDLEYRTEQLRQLKRYEPVKLVLTTATTLVVVIGGLGAGVIWLWHVLH
jgi:hypothetical protein